MSPPPHRRAIRSPLWLALAAVAVAGCKTTPPARTEREIINAANTPPATPTTGPSADNPSIARINGLTVTRSELDDLLYRAYGVKLLADLVQLDLAMQALHQKGMTLTDTDVDAEKLRSMRHFFEGAPPSEYEQDFKQLQAREHLTAAEFDVGFKTTAALRKIVAPLVADQVTDDAVRRAFGLLYGENRRIADITVDNLVQVSEVMQLLKDKQPFEDVAKAKSQDVKTRDMGGHWPPFSAKTPGVPQLIMETAFGMRVGDITKEPLVDGDKYHVIKLLDIIPPKVVNYDDVKADVRRQVEDSLQQQGINQLRKQLQQITVQGITIDDPTIRQQWDAMIAAQQPSGKTLPPAQVVPQIHAAEAPKATRPATMP